MQTVHGYRHPGGPSVDTGSNFFKTASWREIADREIERAVLARQELLTYTCHRCGNQFCETSYFSVFGKPSCVKCYGIIILDYSDLPFTPQSPRDHKLAKPDVRANYEKAYWQFVNAPDHYQAIVELDSMMQWVDASLEPASDGSWVKDPEPVKVDEPWKGPFETAALAVAHRYASLSLVNAFTVAILVLSSIAWIIIGIGYV
jgi:hypothetical protein